MAATPPTDSALEAFLEECQAVLPEGSADRVRTRCIGWNDETSQAICEHVIAGDKTGTFSVPWLHADHPNTKPDIGNFIVLLTYDGTPRALLQTMALEFVTFKDIDTSHTGLDGPSVRDLEVWRGIHTKYWNDLLAPLGRAVEDDMPVIVERFVCRYPAA